MSLAVAKTITKQTASARAQSSASLALNVSPVKTLPRQASPAFLTASMTAITVMTEAAIPAMLEKMTLRSH